MTQTKTKLPYGAQVDYTPFGIALKFPNGGFVDRKTFRALMKWDFKKDWVTKHWIIADTPLNRELADNIKDFYNLNNYES